MRFRVNLINSPFRVDEPNPPKVRVFIYGVLTIKHNSINYVLWIALLQSSGISGC